MKKTITILAILLSGFLGVNAEMIDTLTAKKAAIYYGNQKWGNVSIEHFELLLDPLTEEPKAYVFTLNVSDEKADFKSLIRDVIQAKKDFTPGARVQGRSSIQMEKIKAKIVDTYGTVMIAANDELPPLILRHPGIHDSYFQSEDLNINVNSIWSNDSIQVGKKYLLNALTVMPSYKKKDGELYLYSKDRQDFKKSDIRKDKKFSFSDTKKINQKSKSRKSWQNLKSKISVPQGMGEIDISNNSLDLPLGAIVEQGYINGVPFYNQDIWANSVCSEVSTAQVFAYWDDLYPNLIDWGVDDIDNNFPGIDDMVRDLMVAMQWNAADWTLTSNMEPGMLEFCNSSTYRNNLDFSINRDNLVRWNIIQENIDNYCPMVVAVYGGFYDADGLLHNLIGHAMTLVGYSEEEDPDNRMIIVHPNQSGGGLNWSQDYEINFDMPDNGDMIIWRIYPDGEDNTNPMLTINSPNGGGNFSGSIPLNVIAADASGIWWMDFQYSTDGSNWHEAGQLYNTSHDVVNFTYNFNSASSVQYAENVWIRARSVDNWGMNVSDWDVIDNPITIDNRAPEPSYIISTMSLSPSSGVEPYSSVRVSGTAVYDLGSNVTGTVEITSAGNTWTASVVNGTYSRDIYAPENSGYVYIRVSDGSLEATNQSYISVLNEGNGDNFNFNRSAMCQDVQDSDPWDPINETHYFRSDDEIAYCWAHLTDLYTPVRLRWEWFAPDGSNHLDDTYSDWTDDPEDYGYGYYYDWKLAYGYYIDGYSQSDLEGRHSVNIYAAEEGGSYDFMESQYYVISYDFKEHVLCKDVESLNPVNETSTFSQTDSRVYTWSRYTDVSEIIETRTEWYEPNGQLYTTSEYSIPDPGQGNYYPEYMQWSWIELNGYDAANKCGEWEIRKYEKDPWGNWDLLYTENFKILESPTVQPLINAYVTDQNSIEGSNIIVSISAVDNTDIKNVILYWNDGSDHQYEWNNVFSNTLDVIHSIGPYSEGDEIEYWARIYDSSGNIGESDRKTLVVKDSDLSGPAISNVQITEYNGNGDGIINNTEQVRISCSASDPSGISELRFYVDEVEIPLESNYYAISGPFEVGGYTVIITGIDNDQSPGYTTLYESFNVESDIVLPELSTTPLSSITPNSANSGGIVVSDGGAAITQKGVCWSTSQGPTIALSTITEDGSGMDSYTSSLTGLTVSTTYYIRAYATNSVGTAYGDEVTFTTYAGNAIMDYDGNYYSTLEIGNQTWLGENLKVTHLNDGTEIPNITDFVEWGNMSTGAYCWYNNDEQTHKDVYGALYNWHSVNTGSLCPSGWHVPSEQEWIQLELELGMSPAVLDEVGFRGTDEGAKLKTTYGWETNDNATNETGYSALPAGFRGHGFEDAVFGNLGVFGGWWAATESNTSSAWKRLLAHYSSQIHRIAYLKEAGNSVRCVEDVCAIDVDLGAPITACEGEHISITAGYGFDSYLWNTGETYHTIIVTEPGTYSVTVTDGACSATDAVDLTYNNCIPTTINVSPVGSDVSGDGSEGNPYATIQYAIDNSKYGDKILIAAGTYPENVDIVGYRYLKGDLGRTNLNSVRIYQTEGAVLDGLSFTAPPNSLVAIDSRRAQNVTITNCIIHDDYQYDMFLDGDCLDFKISNNTFIGNNTLFCLDACTALHNVEISNNIATGYGWVMVPFDDHPIDIANLVFSHNNFWNNNHNYDGTYAVEGANGNISEDPLFTDLANRDLSLMPGSPCINAGDPSYPLDDDGSIVEIGAMPYASPMDNHFTPVWYPANGVDHMNLYALTATIDGLDMAAGDEIGIYDGDVCVGAGILEGTLEEGVYYLPIITSKDDEGTTEQDGYIPGNEIRYRLWDSSEGEEITHAEVSYAHGTGIFSVGGSASFYINGTKTIEGSVPVSEGWNILSLPVIPADVRMISIVQSLIDMDCLVKVQDEAGNAIEYIVPIGWVDNIGDWSPSEGYKLRASCDVDLSFSGSPMDDPQVIDFIAGWNIMGYPWSESQSALDAFSDLIDNNLLVKVQDETGNAIENVFPIGWLDNVHDLEPGEGYKVNVSGDCNLTLSKPIVAYKSASLSNVISDYTMHFKRAYPGNGHDHMNIYVMEATLNGSGLQEGDEIGLFDGDVCVGASVISSSNQGVLSIAASMDDPTTTEQDGFIEDHAIEFKIWSKSNSMEITPEIIFQSGYKGMFERMGTTVASIQGEATGIKDIDGLASRSSLGDIYPNPFREETTIPYTIARDTRVDMAIYDLTGKRIRTLVSQELTSGSHMVKWDGRDNNGVDIPAGIYVCRMLAGDVVVSKKIELY